MPVHSSGYGQQITFAIERDDDEKLGSKYVWVHVTSAARTIVKIAAQRGHPEDARAIADLNGIRDAHKKLPIHKRIKLPGQLHTNDVFHVLPQDGQPPTVIGGYAKFETIDRSQRVGLTQFDGYDPITMNVPIQFEAVREALRTGLQPTRALPFPGARLQIQEQADPSAARALERDIALLERMAGRGDFPGTATGPPPIIRISTTNSKGEPVPLLPMNYQWSSQHPSAPLWLITGIEWDAQPLRNVLGNRVRQLAVVTVQQHTRAVTIERSAAKRAKAKSTSSSSQPNTSAQTDTTGLFA